LNRLPCPWFQAFAATFKSGHNVRRYDVGGELRDDKTGLRKELSDSLSQWPIPFTKPRFDGEITPAFQLESASSDAESSSAAAAMGKQSGAAAAPSTVWSLLLCMFHFNREMTPAEMASRHHKDGCKVYMTDTKADANEVRAATRGGGGGAAGAAALNKFDNVDPGDGPSALVQLDYGNRVEDPIEAGAWYSQAWVYSPLKEEKEDSDDSKTSGGAGAGSRGPPASIALASLDLHNHMRADGHELLVVSGNVMAGGDLSRDTLIFANFCMGNQCKSSIVSHRS
jgi:hypothetical protein